MDEAVAAFRQVMLMASSVSGQAISSCRGLDCMQHVLEKAYTRADDWTPYARSEDGQSNSELQLQWNNSACETLRKGQLSYLQHLHLPQIKAGAW